MNVSANKVVIRYSAIILYAGAAYLFSLYTMPLFGEYIEAVKHDIAAKDGTVVKDDQAISVPHEWETIESNYFTVYYRPGTSLERIERRLSRRTSYFGHGGISDDAAIEDKIGYKMDVLFRRVKEILDMFPNIPKLKIKIFNTREELNEEYFKIFRTKEDFKSFYIYKYNTIYASEEDISDSVIAHEMGHAIVDHYFAIIPPGKIAEVLASYVNTHLED